MRLVLISLLALTTVNGYAQQADSLQIIKQVNAMVSDFNTHRFANMDNYCAPDVEWVNIVGMRWKGLDAVKKAHQDIFDAIFNGVSFQQKSVDVRRLTSDVWVACLVTHVGDFYPPDGVDRGTNKFPAADNVLTLVYVKKNSRWLLTNGQNTQVLADAAKNDPVNR